MRLRFFLDAGSGVCLWAWDAPAKKRFGYAVELDDVPLPHDLVADLMHLMADYDATIDWDNPTASSNDGSTTAFGYESDAPFRERIAALLPRLRVALGDTFEVESDYEA